MSKEVGFTDARARLSELLDEVEEQHEHVVITRNGRTAAVLMSPAEYEAIQETLDLLQDEELMSSLRRSAEDVKAGRVHPWDEVRRELGLA